MRELNVNSLQLAKNGSLAVVQEVSESEITLSKELSEEDLEKLFTYIKESDKYQELRLVKDYSGSDSTNKRKMTKEGDYSFDTMMTTGSTIRKKSNAKNRIDE